jgi:glycosyltransferase involved in cell wall biosynthesis
MRLLHLIHQYPPDKLGGTELYTQQLTAAQAVAGNEVHVFYRQDGPGVRLEHRQDDNGVHVWAARSGPVTSASRFRALFDEPTLANALTQVLTASNPDLVHIQHYLGLPASALGAFAHLPRVITLHDYWWICANAQLLTNYDATVCDGPRAWVNCARCALARAGRDRLWPASPMLAPLMAWRQRALAPFWRGAARLITPTAFARDWYAAHGLPADRLQVVPHGIDLPEEMPVPTAAGDAQLRVGYLGGVAPQKGVHVLIDAFNELPVERFKLTVMGDLDALPDYVQALRAAATHPGINFAGRLDRPQLWQALTRLDVLVVPSLWYETAALVIQEAHAAGVPVIASDLGALSERVQHDVDGWLIPPGDAGALRQALSRLGSDRTALSRLVAGIGPVRTMATHAAEIAVIYQSCLAGAGRQRRPGEAGSG